MGEKKKLRKKKEDEPEGDVGPPKPKIPKDPALYDYEPARVPEDRDVIRDKQAPAFAHSVRF